MKEKIQEIVSRETMEKFEAYYQLLEKWNNHISLVQENTLKNFWQRHILDSLQLNSLIENEYSILDVGSGAGFPGMVLAMHQLQNVYLCESNRKKAIFLEEVARLTNTKVSILCKRVETIDINFNVIVSRACSNIDKLLHLTNKIVSRETFKFCLFLKGKTFERELEESQINWNFENNVINSMTDKESAIVKLWDIRRR